MKNLTSISGYEPYLIIEGCLDLRHLVAQYHRGLTIRHIVRSQSVLGFFSVLVNAALLVNLLPSLAAIVLSCPFTSFPALELVGIQLSGQIYADLVLLEFGSDEHAIVIVIRTLYIRSKIG